MDLYIFMDLPFFFLVLGRVMETGILNSILHINLELSGEFVLINRQQSCHTSQGAKNQKGAGQLSQTLFDFMAGG